MVDDPGDVMTIVLEAFADLFSDWAAVCSSTDPEGGEKKQERRKQSHSCKGWRRAVEECSETQVLSRWSSSFPEFSVE